MSGVKTLVSEVTVRLELPEPGFDMVQVQNYRKDFPWFPQATY